MTRRTKPTIRARIAMLKERRERRAEAHRSTRDIDADLVRLRCAQIQREMRDLERRRRERAAKREAAQ
jgi:hypothetical protein